MQANNAAAAANGKGEELAFIAPNQDGKESPHEKAITALSKADVAMLPRSGLLAVVQTLDQDGEAAALKVLQASYQQYVLDLLSNKDIWVNCILPFLGPGHFVYVAGVCKRFKEFYLDYFAAIKDAPKIRAGNTVLGPLYGQLIPAIPTSTFYSATFSSLPCAEFWGSDTKVGGHHFGDNWVCLLIAKHGNSQVLRWAGNKGCPWNSNTCNMAAEYGNLDILKYAHENGCEWDWATCHYAAMNGHLECLQYAHGKGCELNAMAKYEAAAHGHLECLQYLHENDCEWSWLSPLSCSAAAENGQLECLKFLHEKGCP